MAPRSTGRVRPQMRVEFDPRQRQQIVDQARHAGRLRLHDLEKALARGGVVARRALQRLDEARAARPAACAVRGWHWRRSRRAFPRPGAAASDRGTSTSIRPPVGGVVTPAIGRDEHLVPAIDRHPLEELDPVRDSSRPRAADRVDDLGIAQRRSTPARRGATPARSCAASAFIASTPPCAIERNDRVGQPGQHRSDQPLVDPQHGRSPRPQRATAALAAGGGDHSDDHRAERHQRRHRAEHRAQRTVRRDRDGGHRQDQPRAPEPAEPKRRRCHASRSVVWPGHRAIDDLSGRRAPVAPRRLVGDRRQRYLQGRGTRRARRPDRELELRARRGSSAKARTGRCNRAAGTAAARRAVASLSNCQSATSMAASNTPRPPGEWLAKPSRVAETKITASVMKSILRLVRHQHVHRERAEAEIDDADADLQERQRAARQRHAPAVPADDRAAGSRPRRHRRPGCTGRGSPALRLNQSGNWSIARRGLRRVGDAQPEHGGIAEPERQAGDKADLGHLDGAEAPGRIDAVAHRAAGEDAGADIVADRIAGEAGKRRDPIGNVAAADRAQRKQVIERQREIAAGDEQRGERNVPPDWSSPALRPPRGG